MGCSDADSYSVASVTSCSIFLFDGRTSGWDREKGWGRAEAGRPQPPCRGYSGSPELPGEDREHPPIRFGILHRDSNGVCSQLPAHAPHVAQKKARGLATGNDRARVRSRRGKMA